MTDADRLQKLEDIFAIQQLFIDYCIFVDAGDSAGLAGLFAAEGSIKLGPSRSAVGPAEIEKIMTKYLDGTPGTSYHIVSSPQVTVDGDTAAARVMWTVIDVNPEKGLSVRTVGHHKDEIVREDGVWKFQLRKGYVDAMAPTA
ncbi:MAG: hypothetical protein JWM76_457 [Pseudonocardiales bacterium]|nr:hypothetical protein [Pseudonocardiales bacterium]